ncbi:MAG: hypothetical protein KC931_16865 [Candidatus Omnitrophica bacterium]|nr:hypothetical protein [Candidatus Omnitrophota bacterium]
MIRAACLSLEITPDQPIDLSGGPFGKSRGVLDPLEAYILLLEIEGECFCWMTVDTIYLSSSWTDPLREKIARLLTTGRANTMISATHTHSGAAFMPLRQWGSPDMCHTDWVSRRILDGVRDLQDRLQPVRGNFGSAQADGVTVNRREPGGPVDEEVSVLTLHNNNGQPIAMMVHFTCHPVTLWGFENKFSPDFPGYLRTALRQVSGGIPVFFINGAAGNINPAGFSPESTSVEYSKDIAKRVCSAARQAMLNSQPLNLSPLVTAEERETLLLDPPPSVETIHRIIEEADSHLNGDWSPESVGWARKKEWAIDLLAAIETGELADRESLEIQSVRLGALRILALPGDPYVEIGLKMKEISPSPHTLIAGFTNGMVGYLCTRKWQEENGEQEKFIGYRLLSMPKETEKIVYRMTERLVERMRHETV